MPKILVVDDEEHIRRLLRKFLESAQYEVVEAADGAEALEMNRIDPADLVITDVLMPGMEGFGFIREMTREFPETKLIAISGGGTIDSNEYLTLIEKFGVDRTFAKPFRRAEILEGVAAALAED